MYQFRYGYCTPLIKPSMIVPHKGTSTSFGGSGTGNMIVVSEEDGVKEELELISRPATDRVFQDTRGVRSLAVLDNENSFLSGGKDRTVMVGEEHTLGRGRLLLGPSLCIQDTVSQYSLLVS